MLGASPEICTPLVFLGIYRKFTSDFFWEGRCHEYSCCNGYTIPVVLCNAHGVCLIVNQIILNRHKIP